VRFEKLHVTGFGALRDLELSEIGPGLNIIEGANEAGKTTLLEFVRALFFGFAQRDRSTGDAQRYMPIGGGAHGGWAIVQNSHAEKLRIERVGDKSSAGTCSVQLLGANREVTLDTLLVGADRMLYEQIFAFSLDELNGLSASAEQMEKRVYAASSGNLELLSALENAATNASDIYTKRGRNQPLNVAIAEYKKLQDNIKALGDQIENYNADRAQLQQYQEKANSLHQQYKTAERELIAAQQRDDVWPTWVKLAGLRQDLAALPARPELTDEQIHAMEQWRSERRQCREKLEEIQPRLEHVEAELKKHIIDAAVIKNAADITYLKEQLALYESVLREQPGLEQKCENSTQQIQAQLEQLGPGWDEARLAKIDISREPRLAIQQFEKTLDETHRQWDEAHQSEVAIARQIAELQKSQQRLREEMQQEFAREPLATDAITQQSHALQDADELLRNAQEASSRCDMATENLKTRQKYFSQSQKSVYAPKVLFPAWWAVFPLIAGLVGMLLWHNEFGIATFVLCLFIAAAIAWMALRHKQDARRWEQEQQAQRAQHETEMAQLQEQIDSWQAEAAQARDQVQQLAAQFGWVLENRTDIRNFTELLQRHREARSRYDNLLRDIKRREDDIAQITESQQESQDNAARAKSTFEQHQSAWRTWLQERHLPASATPQNALQLFDLMQKIRDELRKRHECQQQCEALKQQQQQYETRVHDLWKQLQRPAPAANDIPAAVRALFDELDLHKKQHVRREALLAEQKDWQENLSIQEKRLADNESQITALLQTVQAADEDDFDAKTQIAEQHQKIYDECRKQEEILDTHSAPGPARLALEKILAELDAATVKEKLYTAKEVFERCQSERLEAERQQGEWNNRIRQWEENEGQLSALLRQQEEQKTRIADLIAQWAVERATYALLDDTRRRFEKERQPAVIKRAGALMQNVTDGRYQAVLTSGKLQSVELDEGERGRKPLSHWSRGTKEQFYLALRLAFIEDYCNQGHQEPLPVVMDDVLVHADGYQRLEAASAMIAAFAEKYQVLYFTCRPGDADVLSKASPAAQRFRLGSSKVLLAESTS